LLTIDRFLWVAFQLDSICSEATDESIVNALQLLPKDLPETFNRILRKLEQIKAADPRLCKRIFELVAAAQRPLTLEELRDAISVVPGETAWNVQKLVNDMHKTLDCCGSLLVVDEEHSTVHFAHHSVKQHLLSSFTDPNVEQYHVRSLEADSSLGEICVTYLNFEVFNTQLTKTKTVPQSQAVDVPSAILRGTLPRSKIVNKLALRLLKSRGDAEYDIFSQLQEAAGHATEFKNRIRREHSFLSYAQEYWLFHSKSFEPTREISYPLWRRLVTGVVGTVRLPWTPEDWSDLGFELLKWTVENEHGALLYRIFDKFDGRKDAKIDLLWEMLLEKGIEFHVQDKYYGNALQMASASGHEAVVQLLLEKGVALESKDKDYGRTPLSWAAKSGHEAVAKLLLEKGAALESKNDKYGLTPLSWAARSGHEAVAKLLLEKGAALESKDKYYGRTPLSWAAGNGHEAVAKLLFEKGAALESKDDKKYGRTPLSWAAGDGHEAVAKLLLEKGAALESKDKYGRTPLLWAAGNGHEAVAKLLLEKGAALESKDEDYGRTPLSWAVGNGHEAVAKLLLEKGAALESKDNYGRTPLWWAARNGHETVAKLLLEKGAALESKDNYGQTPLSLAVGNGHEAVAKLLLEKGAALESKDNDGRTPLWWAAAKGHEAVAKLLLEKGAALESKDNDGRTPLSWAAAYGHEAVVKLLLEKGAAPESKDNGGRTPLWWATAHGHEAVAKLLLEKGAALESKDDNDGRKAGENFLEAFFQGSGNECTTCAQHADEVILLEQ
jgi:ankyrin repeat protein